VQEIFRTSALIFYRQNRQCKSIRREKREGDTRYLAGLVKIGRFNCTKKEEKKRKKLRNRGFLTVFLKNGVVDGSKKRDFIGLIRFWAKNEGKNEHFLVFFCTFLHFFNRN
jgi:hypothetical protein